jgi:hypothetical protein
MRRALLLAALLLAPAPITAQAPGQIAPQGRFVFIGQATQGGWLRGLAPRGTGELRLDGKPVPLASDGTFFIAFDRDAATSERLEATLSGGGIVGETLAISPRAWDIQHVDAPFHPPGLPEAEFTRIRTGELAEIAAAHAIMHDSQGWRQAFAWPVTGRVSGHFGAQRIFRGTPGTYHSGLDIAAAAGTPIRAPADGVVVLAAEAPFTLEGHLLLLDHGMGLGSAFLHCSQLLVHVGESVRQGQVIARVGMTGRATGPHLHWSLRWQEARLDPLLFVGDSPAHP